MEPAFHRGRRFPIHRRSPTRRRLSATAPACLRSIAISPALKSWGGESCFRRRRRSRPGGTVTLHVPDGRRGCCAQMGLPGSKSGRGQVADGAATVNALSQLSWSRPRTAPRRRSRAGRAQQSGRSAPSGKKPHWAARPSSPVWQRSRRAHGQKPRRP